MLNTFFVFLAETSSEATRKIIELQYVHFPIFYFFFFTYILGESFLYKKLAN